MGFLDQGGTFQIIGVKAGGSDVRAHPGFSLNSRPSHGGTSKPRKELSTKPLNVDENLIVRDQLC